MYFVDYIHWINRSEEKTYTNDMKICRKRFVRTQENICVAMWNHTSYYYDIIARKFLIANFIQNRLTVQNARMRSKKLWYGKFNISDRTYQNIQSYQISKHTFVPDDVYTY